MEDLIRALFNASPREQLMVMVLFGGAAFFALMTGLLGAWIGAYLGGRRGARRETGFLDPASSGVAEAQLRELQQAVETIALEVERISEGQRFTARMLMERMPASAPIVQRREGGSITPH